MIVFKTLQLRNFLSYGAAPTIINLDQPGTTLILGEDLDNTDRGAGANGVGKTVIINALVYALYDKPISNISKDNLVNNVNKKNMEVALEFVKGDNTYTIVRARKTKAGAAGNWVKLYINGVDKTPDSVGNTNKEIEDIIGLPFDLFVRIVAVSANHTPFLDLPVRHPTNANQTDIIEELFDLKQLSEKANMLKDEIKTMDQSVDIQQGRLDAVQRENDRHHKLIDSATRRVIAWQIGHDKDIEVVKQKLAKIADIDVENERAAFDEISDVDTAVRDTSNTVETIGSEVRKISKLIADSESELSHLDDGECPYCLQKYADTEVKVNNLKETVRVSTTMLEAMVTDLDDQKYNLNILKERQAELREIITVSSVDELYDIKGKMTGYEKQLRDLENATNPMLEQLDELEAVELEELDMSKINELKNIIDHQKFLLKLLTKKDSFVRKALLNKNIPFLNQRLAGYLMELGLPHTVEFSHEMTAEISQFGRPMDFGNLSNGQRARVNIALSFAFRDVLQSIHQRVNVCMLDEVLDVGLDAVGVQSAAKMLKSKAREEKLALYIISHRDEIDNAFDRTMTIQMSKGFSYLGEINE
jgi:DNA repair exonuclease SbcCD ATPase subunit